jgi:ATP-dependent helicase/DNAse subunit B
MRGCARDVFTGWEAEHDVGDERLWGVTKSQIAAVLELFIKYEEESFTKEPFSTIETEFKFGREKNRVALKAGGRSIKLTGEIDRVDYLPRKRLLRIIDYKHTANIHKYSRLLQPETFCLESFQVPIYLFASLSIIGKSGGFPAPLGGYGAYYAVKKEPKLSPRAGKASLFDDVAANGGLGTIAKSPEFGGRIAGLVDRMESGDFSVTPQDCIFCKYRSVCRYQEVRKVETCE